MSRCLGFICLVYPIAVTSFSVFSAEVKDIKLKSSHGRYLVSELAKSMEKQDTTTSRQEQKTVVRLDDLRQALDQVREPFYYRSSPFKPKKEAHIEMETRDHADEIFKNVTFTFYGRGFFFWNLGIKTKIKLRARFYLQKIKETGELRRSARMATQSFLEIKVKNPSSAELGSVNKFRFKIDDQDLQNLFSMNAEATDYLERLQNLEMRLKNKEESSAGKALIGGVFMAIKDLSLRHRDFIKPIIAVSYERDAVKFIEAKYKIRQHLLKRKNIRDLEYQITMDQNVKGYFVDGDLLTRSPSYIEYFQESARDCICAYPDDSVVVEVKIPRIITSLKKKRRSAIHNYFLSTFVEPLFDLEHLYPGFRLNKGKAGHIKRIIRSSPMSELRGPMS